MTVGQKAFKSDFGYQSPGFSVDDQGNLIANDFILSGSGSLFSSGGTALNSIVINSSLRTLGTLTQLQVNGDVYLKNNNVNRLSVVSGRVVINSQTVGTVDNVNIGTLAPGTVAATQVNLVSNGVSPAGFNMDNADISASGAEVNGVMTFVDGLLLPIPTSAAQAVRKDYVDNSVIAFAVAFGA